MVKYLVCREALLRPHNRVNSSDHFPMVVEVPFERPAEDILYKALDSINEGYRPHDYKYVVVPLRGARVVRLRPIRNFAYEVTDYDG